MEDFFKICSKIRPITTTLTSFMAGMFFCEKIYWISFIMMLIVFGNLFYLKSTDQNMKKYGILPSGKKNLKPKFIKPKSKKR